MLKDLLVHVDSTDAAARRLGAAVELAARFGARLTGLLAEGVSIGASIVGRRDPDQVAKAAALARERFEAKVKEAGVESRWWGIRPRDDAELAQWVVQCCRYVDLSIFGPPDGGGERVPDDLVAQVVFESGRPVLAIPPRVPLGRIGERVLLAWTGSRASARALNDALPLLPQAKEIRVLSLQLPSTSAARGELPSLDVVAHLAAHGITASYERFILGELGAVDHVLNRATDMGADLIVMGAHGGRGIQALRHEDTTGAILHTMIAPVLLAH